MTSEAQRKAVKKYKEKVKRITIDFYPSEAELWDHIQQQPNKHGYIKDLIRRDMKGEEQCVRFYSAASSWTTASG